MDTVIKVGISTCLLGERVRYDGGHKRDPYLTEILGRYFTFVPVCPEVECGMPVPREAMRLEGDPEAPRLVTVRTRQDKTEQMLSFCRDKVRQLAHEELCGFIFKKDSPSSGLHRVKVYKAAMPARNGRGLFADAVAKAFPLLPVEEEGRLNDPALRENFIESVFTYSRWKTFLKKGPTFGAVVEFHTDHKLLVMAHSPAMYREMGKLVAAGKGMPLSDFFTRYEQLLMTAMAHPATVAKNTNVLQHVMGYFKKELSPAEKSELVDIIRQYHDKLVPLIVPITLLKHYCRKYEQGYLLRQHYLSPHPSELSLRNHA